MTSDGTVLTRQVRDSAVLVTLNRPATRNALDAGLLHALAEFWTDFASDDTLKVAIITGAGDRAFSAGRDMKAPTGEISDAAVRAAYPGDRALGKPVIAAINGYCIAAGLTIALGADIRIAAPTAAFRTPYGPMAGKSKALYHLVDLGMPRAVALDMVMTGRPIDADEALHCGLVSRIVPAADLIETAWAIAGEIAANAASLTAGSRRVTEAGLLRRPLHEAMAAWDATAEGRAPQATA